MTQEELAVRIGVSEITVRRWEAGGHPQPAHVRRLCEVLEATAGDLGLARTEPDRLSALELDPGDLPSIEDIEAAVFRLRRSYSTTNPDDLRQRVDVRLNQVRRLLDSEPSSAMRVTLMEAGAWLALLRGTVQADLGQFEAAQTSVLVSRQLAQEIGHAEIEAWTWETAAWMAATDDRALDARELAGAGIAAAPKGGYGLVAVTMQRARINGSLGDEPAALRDLLAGQKAFAAAGDTATPDDHYQIDPGKAAFFASGTFAQLGCHAETIEHAAEVVRRSEDAATRSYWPMRVANARVEWAMALAGQGHEDEAVEMASRAFEARWIRPDTERRTRKLLTRMRDPRLRDLLAGRLQESLAVFARSREPA